MARTSSTATGPAATPPPQPAPPASTRERALDVALELFVARGYEATSLRDIAERLGITKAALWYHFHSKADILVELHLRLHGMGERLLAQLEALPDSDARLRAAPHLVDELITDIDAHRDLVRLQQRNQNAFDALHGSARHIDANDDLERRLARLLDASDLSPAVRVRIACGVGAVMSGLLGGGFLDDIPHDERVRLVRLTAADMFRAEALAEPG